MRTELSEPVELPVLLPRTLNAAREVVELIGYMTLTMQSGKYVRYEHRLTHHYVDGYTLEGHIVLDGRSTRCRLKRTPDGGVLLRYASQQSARTNQRPVPSSHD